MNLMSEAIGQLYDLNKNGLKLKMLIYENNFMFDATQEQEDSFYRTLDGLINKTKNYMINYSEMKHVINTKKFISDYNEKLTSGFRIFDLDEMKDKLEELYNNKTSPNEFIAGAEAIVFWPLRLLNECMYRELNETFYDETFNSLFETIDKDFEIQETKN